MNQSIGTVRNLVMYRASKHAEHYDVLKSRLAAVKPAIVRLYRDGEIRNRNGTSSGVFVKFLLTGDKPFLCHFLGRRSLNYDNFSHQCDCDDEHLYFYDYPLATMLTHFSALTYTTRVARAHVPLHLALDTDEPKGPDGKPSWTVPCDICGNVHAPVR